jgi:hypothetical protein
LTAGSRPGARAPHEVAGESRDGEGSSHGDCHGWAARSCKRPIRSIPSLMRKASYHRARPAKARPDPHSGRIVILGGLLRNLLAINAHYEGRGERLVAVVAQSEDADRFEARVTDAGRLFHVKLRVAAPGVHEYGREEDL